MNANIYRSAIASLAVTPLLLSSVNAVELTPIEALGKHIFFDPISIGTNRISCASCHDPGKGWILPDSTINSTTVVAPGAAALTQGSIKTPPNAYSTFSPIFQPDPNTPPFVVPWKGGNFWDGRAEGYGSPNDPNGLPEGDGAVSDTVTVLDLPLSKREAYKKYLGPTADQALNPFPNNVEQNITEQNVCQRVKFALYKYLYKQAFGEPINCSPFPYDNPAYKTSFKRIAVALAAWQSSEDVNSFSSKRDRALEHDADGKFPLDDFTEEENRGHDIFYGIQSALNPSGKNARCTVCHNGVPEGQPSDPLGEAPQQLYSDNHFHHIGVPFNREIPDVVKGEKTGLAGHVTSVIPGMYRTPTLRNVSKGVGPGFTKAYTHNGWFKSLESLVNFYNTRDVKPKCETLGIIDATEKEAMANNCWPQAEFPGQAVFVVGDLGLTPDEEASLVAYMKTFDDEHTPTKPQP